MSYATQYRDAWRRGINTRGARWAHGVKWRGAAGLGSLDNTQTFAVGQQLVAGYNVQSSADANTKLVTIRGAMAYGFRGAIVDAGWGGPGAPGGVPAGQIWIKVRIAAPGVTGAVMNQVFSAVGQQAQSQLPAGSRVTNTYASLFGGTTGSTTVPTTGGGLIDSLFAPTTTTTTPTTTPTSTLPTDLTATTPQPFFLQEVGGVPVWMLGIGGVALLGGIAFVALRKPHAAPKANRGRRVRRNGWRRRSARTLKGSRRSRRKRTSMRANRRRSRKSRRSGRRSGGYRLHSNRRRSRRSMRRNTKLDASQRRHFRRRYVPLQSALYGFPFLTGRRRRSKLSRKSRASMVSLRRNVRKHSENKLAGHVGWHYAPVISKRRSLRRNTGFEYGVHGNNTGTYTDPFTRMAKADQVALGKTYRTEVAAVRVANRLQRKYGHMITFRVKSRPRSSGGFGQTIRYSHVDVARPHRMRRARARMSRNSSGDAYAVSYRGWDKVKQIGKKYETVAEARTHLKKAKAKDPDYAFAYGIAKYHVGGGETWVGPVPKSA